MSLPAAAARRHLTHLTDVAATRARLGVVPLQRVRASRIPFVTLVTFLLVGGVVTLLLFNTSLQQAAFAEAALARQASTLAAKEQTLKMELEDLRDPQRVAMSAQSLGMVIAPAPQFLRLSDGKVLGAAPDATTESGALRLQPKPQARPAALQPEVIVVEAEPDRSEADGRAQDKKDKKNDEKQTRRGNR